MRGLPPVSVAALVCLGALTSGASARVDDAPAASYNVLLVTLDTTRADHLGCYGYDRPTSPRLDALAAASAVFDDDISQAAVTPVAHASILTGLEPYHHGLRVLHGLVANRLDDRATTLAEVWRRAGGPTAAFVSAFPVTPAFGLGQGFDRFDDEFPQADGAGLVSAQGTVNTGTSQRRADATTERALRWLAERKAQEAPFLLWVHYFDPHDPLLTPPRETLLPQLNGVFRPAGRSRADYLRSVYDAEIHFVDSQLGRLLDALREQKLWKRTIVVVVGDHGEGLGDHDWWGHGILYQEQIRVPLIIRVPGLPKGLEVTSRVRSIDLMPTILEEAGVAPRLRPPMDGESLDEALRTGGLEHARPAYSESINMLRYARRDVPGAQDDKNDKFYCRIDGDLKLIYHQLRPAESELYDLAADPQELKNLAAKRPEAVARLTAELEREKVLSPILPGTTPTDLERLRKLESLGYVR